jgi:cell division protein FtsN
VTRDYKQARIVRKKNFKRKSQQFAKKTTVNNQKFPLLKFVILLMISISATFFITKHFVNKEKIVETKPEKNFNTEQIKAKEQPKLPKQVIIEPITKSKITESSIKYSFYSALAKTEIIVDVEPISIALDDPYFIQAGTFRKEERALVEQSRLAKKGLQLRVSKITIKNKTYYRLRIGPFINRLEMNKTRNILRRLGVDTLLIKSSSYSVSSKGETE